METSSVGADDTNSIESYISDTQPKHCTALYNYTVRIRAEGGGGGSLKGK